MLHIGFITAHHYPRLGGMEYVTHFLVESLNNIPDIHASVACNSLRGIPKDFKYSYPCYRSKSFSYLTPWLFKQNQKNMIRKENIDILHGPMLHGGGKMAMELASEFNLPFVAHSHGSDVQTVKEVNYGALLHPHYKKDIKNVIAKASKLIAVSSINKQNIIDLGAKPEQVEVIHNGIQIEEINRIPFYNERPNLNISEDDFLIITVGRNKPIKRMELLFEALQKLKSYKQIKCLCVGPKENLEKLATDYNVLEKVIFTGEIPIHKDINLQPPYPDLINMYRSADVYVSTSYVEAFSGAATDALACGIPIIIGKKHGVRDVIKNEKTGWVMEKETPDYLAELLVDLYEKKEGIRNNSEFIKQSIQQLNWTTIASQTEALYKSIL